MTKEKIIQILKSFINKTIIFFKLNKFSFLFVISILLSLGSITTLFESNFGFQYFSSVIQREKSHYQISLDVDANNFENSKNCIQQYKSKLGMAFYTMNVYHSPMSYLFVDSKNNPDHGLVIEEETLSLVNFPVFGIEKIVTNGNENFTVGGTDINLIYETNAIGGSSTMAIYISEVFADKLIQKDFAIDYDDLLGKPLSTSGTNSSHFSSVFIANIFQYQEGGSTKLFNFFDDFIITSRLLYSAVPCQEMKVGALIDKKEYSNKVMLETFTNFFDGKNDYEIKFGDQETFDQKYTNLFNNSINHTVNLKIIDICFLSFSLISIAGLLIFLFKKKRTQLLLPSNVGVTFLSLFLIFLVFSLAKMIGGCLLFGSSGITVIFTFSLVLSIMFEVLRKKSNSNS